MPEEIMPGPIMDWGSGIREAVCIHTKKVYDSCREKIVSRICAFIPKAQYVDVINRALSVKGGSAKLLYVYVDVQLSASIGASTLWDSAFSIPLPSKPTPQLPLSCDRRGSVRVR